MLEYMDYQGRGVKVLVVHPTNVGKAINDRRAALGLAPVPVQELEYGMDEVVEVVNRLDAHLLSGRKATIHGLLDILEEGWDVVWLITHADENGWYLTDGIVNVSETTTLIRAAGTFLTVMNTCSSYEVARDAAWELGTAFICTVQEVPDRQAFITGVVFAQKLAQGLDYITAYEQAKPGQNSTYRLIEARVPMPPPNERVRYATGQTMPDAETLHRFIRSVQDLDLIVNGSSKFGLPPLRDLTRELQGELETIRKQLEEIKERQRIRNWLMWGLAVVDVALLITVALLVAQTGGA